MNEASYKAVVMGASSGGLEALGTVLGELDEDYALPVVVVQHMGPDSEGYLADHLDEKCAIRVKEADEKERLEPGTVYIAPANYHLLVEDDGTLSLSTEERIRFARPSVDVLFESAAMVFGETLVGVVLTGGNDDGGRGLAAVKSGGGLAIVQDPATATAPEMPQAALGETEADHVLPLEDIGPFLNTLAHHHG